MRNRDATVHISANQRGCFRTVTHTYLLPWRVNCSAESEPVLTTGGVGTWETPRRHQPYRAGGNEGIDGRPLTIVV